MISTLLGDATALANSLWLQLGLCAAILAGVTLLSGQGFAFWATRPGNILLAIIVTAVVVHNLTYRMSSLGQLKAQTQAQAEIISDLQQQAAATRAIADAAAARERGTTQQSQILQDKVKAYADELDKRSKTNSCRLDDTDVRRLRGLAGAAP